MRREETDGETTRGGGVVTNLMQGRNVAPTVSVPTISLIIRMANRPRSTDAGAKNMKLLSLAETKATAPVNKSGSRRTHEAVPKQGPVVLVCCPQIKTSRWTGTP